MRKLFFSFHYKDVVEFRANVVRNHNVVGLNETYIDKSLWESAKVSGVSKIKEIIADALIGTSTTCVLIGTDTHVRRWVRYEIVKSLERGNGLFGVHINSISDKFGRTYSLGENPFAYIAYKWEQGSALVYIYEKVDGVWKSYTDVPTILKSSIKHPISPGYFDFQYLAEVYNWTSDNGYQNFGNWAEKAALNAGR